MIGRLFFVALLALAAAACPTRGEDVMSKLLPGSFLHCRGGD